MQRTKRDIAYQKIKEMILQGKITTDSIFSEKNLADELGMSRTPVREALQKLTHEGVMKGYFRKGTMINDVSASEALEIIELRMAVEEFVALRLTDRLRDSHIAELQEILREESGMIESCDSDGFLESDVRFHNILTRAYGNQLICDTLSSIRERFIVAGGLILRDRPSIEKAFQGHVEIVEALTNGRAEAARDAMHEHLLFAKKNYLN